MSRMSRRSFIATAAAASLARPALAAGRTSLIVAEPIHGTGYLPLYVAIEKGFFGDVGLDVKVVTIESGAGHTNAVLSGQAFSFIGGPEHCAFAKAKGAELRAVVNVVNRGNVYYLAAKGKEPAAGMALKDYFKGKTIATGFYGGTPNSITRYYLDQWKLDSKRDVTLLETTTAAIMAAVKTGRADIAVLSEPQITQGIREGLWGEPFLNVPKDLGDYAYSTLNVRLDSIAKEPQTVAAFVAGVQKGLNFTYEHPEEAAAVAKKEFPTMAAADMKATLDRSFADLLWSRDGTISQAAWTTAEKVVRSADILKQDVPYAAIIDTQFVKPTKA